MSDSVLKKQGIYIDIDALFDTRLATIYQMNSEALEPILNDNYFTRNIDIFKNIDRKEFQEKYRNRDKYILKNAMITRIVNTLREIVDAITKQLITNPFHTGAKIYLNVHPYNLLPEEETLIIKGLVHVTKHLADIELVNLRKEELTPRFIKNNLAVMFMYEYSEWMECQAEAFKELPCVDVCVIAPAIYFYELPTPADLDKMLEKQLNPFKAVELVAAPLIGIKLHEVEMFCANIK